MNQQIKQPICDHVFYGLTRSLCPECKRVVDAQTLIRDGAVYLRKRCPEHGWHEALVSSDAEWYLNSLKYDKPGAMPLDFATSTDRGCPYDCGICPEHRQHTCLALIEITTRCNLACPTCFADSSLPLPGTSAPLRGTGASQVDTNPAARQRGFDLSLAQVEAITASVQIGRIYKGKVSSVKDFGAFIEILPGRDGRCHISELSNDYVGSVTDICNVGDEIEVKVIAVDEQDRIKLSRKAAEQELAGAASDGKE